MVTVVHSNNPSKRKHQNRFQKRSVKAKKGTKWIKSDSKGVDQFPPGLPLNAFTETFPDSSGNRRPTGIDRHLPGIKVELTRSSEYARFIHIIGVIHRRAKFRESHDLYGLSQEFRREQSRYNHHIVSVSHDKEIERMFRTLVKKLAHSGWKGRLERSWIPSLNDWTGVMKTGTSGWNKILLVAAADFSLASSTHLVDCCLISLTC